MTWSRRSVIRHLGLGAAATAVPSIAGASLQAASATAAAGSGSAAPIGPIRLDTTDNGYGPSPLALAVMREALVSAGRQPAAESDRLREAIAIRHGVGAEQVVLGCGSGDVIRMAAAAFTGPGKKLVMASPTCELIKQYAVRRGGEVIQVPLRADYAHDLPLMLTAVDAETGLVYICNPNSPTGTLTRRQHLEAFLERVPANTPVLIDEVYHDYVEPASDTVSFVDQPLDDDRIIVVRSFSKMYGMAGLRVGYGITSSRIASLMAFWALDDNLNVVAARAAAVAIEDAAHARQRAILNANDRQEFLNQASARMLRRIDSQTNFVMLDTQRQVGLVIRHFTAHGIVLAPPFPPFNTHIRISLGTPAEMQEFWRVWDRMAIPPLHGMGM